MDRSADAMPGTRSRGWDAGTSALDGRTALVTSSSRNLGAAVARALAVRGATVAVTYHSSRGAAADLVDQLRSFTDRAHAAVPIDAGSVDGILAMTAEATDALGGRVDVLVNNSGPFAMDPFASLPEQEWDRIWDSNVKAAYLATRAVVPGMRQSGWGRIINISAGSAYLRNHSIYGLAKDALITLTESLALELGPEITVNAVAPGQIDESAGDVEAFDPTFVPRAIARTPAGRLVSRAEVAQIVAELCEPTFDMVTGATIPVDGGWRFNRF